MVAGIPSWEGAIGGSYQPSEEDWEFWGLVCCAESHKINHLINELKSYDEFLRNEYRWGLQ